MGLIGDERIKGNSWMRMRRERGRDCDYPALGYEERRREIEKRMERREGREGEANDTINKKPLDV